MSRVNKNSNHALINANTGVHSFACETALPLNWRCPQVLVEVRSHKVSVLVKECTPCQPKKPPKKSQNHTRTIVSIFSSVLQYHLQYGILGTWCSRFLLHSGPDPLPFFPTHLPKQFCSNGRPVNSINGESSESTSTTRTILKHMRFEC